MQIEQDRSFPQALIEGTGYTLAVIAFTVLTMAAERYFHCEVPDALRAGILISAVFYLLPALLKRARQIRVARQTSNPYAYCLTSEPEALSKPPRSLPSIGVWSLLACTGAGIAYHVLAGMAG